MSLFLVALAALVVVAMVGGVAVAGIAALRNKANFERDSRLGPGLSSSAPTAWAGSHDPEARLHRRLRDVVAALSANQSFDMNGSLLDLRVELEQQAMALDEQLVATAALPLHVRAEPLARIVAAVESVEQAVAELARTSAEETAARLRTALEDIRIRTGLVAQARAALEELADAPGTPSAAQPAADTAAPQIAAPETSPPTPGVSSPSPPADASPVSETPPEPPPTGPGTF